MWYNEEFLAPFFLNHYSWVDKIHLILDADTTDSTESIANRYSNVEFEQFQFPDMMDDLLKVNKFTEKYRSLTEADYVILVDSDEFIFCNHLKKPVRDHLEETMKDVYFVNFWQVYKNEQDSPLEPERPVFCQRRHGDPNMFDPFNILFIKPVVVKGRQDLSWTKGNHEIIYKGKSLSWKTRNSDELEILNISANRDEMLQGAHWRLVDLEETITRRIHNRKNRQSRTNLTMGLTTQYHTITKEEIVKEYNDHKNDPEVIADNGIPFWLPVRENSDRKSGQINKLTPSTFDEIDYLQRYPDVAQAVKEREANQTLTAQAAELEQVFQTLTVSEAEITSSKTWRVVSLLFHRIWGRHASPNRLRARLLSLLKIIYYQSKKIRRDRRLKQDLGLIRSSGLFDGEWYLVNNPDVAQAKGDSLMHYLFYGGFEGRDPGPNFSNKWYLDTYKDVKRAGINPLVHYLRYGREEGRFAVSARMPPMKFPLGKNTLHAMGPTTKLEQVDQFWGNSPSLQELRLISWMEHPRIKRYINSRTTGDPTLTWLPYVTQKFIPLPLNHALSLGCGKGSLEREVLSNGTVETFDAIDISSVSIDYARNAAQRLGLGSKVNYIVANLNELRLVPQKYDAVFASGTMHHVEALEALCAQICLSLRDGGYFICDEFIGPTRFQLPADRLQLINELLAILPARFRWIFRNGKVTTDIKTAYQNLPLAHFDKNDPSEAVRSADIMSVIRQHFHIIEYRPYGGGILHFLLENIVGNFQNDRDEDIAWLDILTYIEQVLEKRAFIDSDFALIVATPIKP